MPCGDLIRIGGDADGGYVVPSGAMQRSTLVLSMGLNDDWAFEKEFRERTGARILCFDGSVDSRFWWRHFVRHVRWRKPRRALRYFGYRAFFSTDQVQHQQLMVGPDDTGSVSLDTIISGIPDREIFLKIDIEGGEYAILDQIVRHADRFTGIVMEFHELDHRRDRVDQFLRALTDFEIVFLHPNNYLGTDQNGDSLLLEFSLVRRDLFVPAAPGTPRVIAVPPTDPGKPAITLNFASA